MASGQFQKSDLEAVLKNFQDPETGRNVVETGQVGQISIDGENATLQLGLTTHSAPLQDIVREELQAMLTANVAGLKHVDIQFVEHHRPPQPLGQIGLKAKSVIAVGSGKGGVGKSTMAAAIAFGLKRSGCSVGLMDADVYGPSIPHLLGLSGRPEVVENRIEPHLKDGMPVMSMGFLVPADEPVVWRGPMLHGAITQFLRDTNWGELDYLIIDMPPGTGDIALTLSQLLPLSGAVIVCTPQDVALLDAVKAIAMFRKVNIPVLGMIENMSGFISPDTGQRFDIFGSGGAKKRAAEVNAPFLGEIPIEIDIRKLGDEGRVEEVFNTPSGAALAEVCVNVARQLAVQARETPLGPQLPVLG